MEKSLSLDLPQISRLFKQNLVLPLHQYNPHPFPTPTSISDKTAVKSDDLSPKSFFFLQSKQPFAVRFSQANCNVCPEVIPENLCAKTRIRLLATHSLGTKFTERGCYGFFSLWKFSAYYGNYVYMINQLNYSIRLLPVSSYPSQSIIW